jgi:hypothetical protein
MKISQTEYWNKLLDLLPEFKNLNHFVHDVMEREEFGVPFPKIKNRDFLEDYLLTASERFELILLAKDYLMEIEQRKKSSPTSFDVDFDDTFEAIYHFNSFISLVMSFLNSLAWLINIGYDMGLERSEIEFRRSETGKVKKVITKLQTDDKQLYDYIINSFDWIDELIRFRDILHHRQKIDFLLVMDDPSHQHRLYIPIDPEMLNRKYIGKRFETDLEFGKRLDEIKTRKGGVTQPLMPFIDDKMRKLVELTNFICKKLLNKLT